MHHNAFVGLFFNWKHARDRKAWLEAEGQQWAGEVSTSLQNTQYMIRGEKTNLEMSHKGTVMMIMIIMKTVMIPVVTVII